MSRRPDTPKFAADSFKSAGTGPAPQPPRSGDPANTPVVARPPKGETWSLLEKALPEITWRAEVLQRPVVFQCGQFRFEARPGDTPSAVYLRGLDESDRTRSARVPKNHYDAPAGSSQAEVAAELAARAAKTGQQQFAQFGSLHMVARPGETGAAVLKRFEQAVAAETDPPVAPGEVRVLAGEDPIERVVTEAARQRREVHANETAVLEDGKGEKKAFDIRLVAKPGDTAADVKKRYDDAVDRAQKSLFAPGEKVVMAGEAPSEVLVQAAKKERREVFAWEHVEVQNSMGDTAHKWVKRIATPDDTPQTAEARFEAAKVKAQKEHLRPGEVIPPPLLAGEETAAWPGRVADKLADEARRRGNEVHTMMREILPGVDHDRTVEIRIFARPGESPEVIGGRYKAELARIERETLPERGIDIAPGLSFPETAKELLAEAERRGQPLFTSWQGNARIRAMPGDSLERIGQRFHHEALLVDGSDEARSP